MAEDQLIPCHDVSGRDCQGTFSVRRGTCDTCDFVYPAPPSVPPPPPSSTDAVNHPPHYTFDKYEVIEVIEDWALGFHLGNAVKYIARAGRKDPAKCVEDLKKARWYLERRITQLEEER